jgi:thiosulfate dehydrogenase
MKNSSIAILIGTTIISGIALLWWVFSKPLPDYCKINDNNVEYYWLAPDVNRLPDNDSGKRIKYGRELIMNTSRYLGPKGSVFPKHTNGMNCQNCHLDAGTKIWGNNYSAVFTTYPKYRARSGTIENIYKRVNDCLERSLNGKPLDSACKEMQAIKAYVEWLGTDVEKGKKPKGSGIYDLPFMDRAADPVKGKIVYVQKCQSCHQVDGAGIFNEAKTEYIYPPLWGEHSYNIGAGLYRLSRFAGYIKYNMPLGTNFQNPQLTDDEAWNVAAYVNSQPRPGKNISKDWPKIIEKPVDHPFGPFQDTFSERMHKFGPFKPIAEEREKKQRTKSTT